MEQHAAEAQLTEAAAEVMASAAVVKAHTPMPVRIEPLAVVLGHKDGRDIIATVQILDIAQRISGLQMAVQKLNGFAFLFLYDGFITNDVDRIDALLLITGSKWGTFTATAKPYRDAGLGCTFDTEMLDVPQMAEPYRSVFA